MGTEVLEILFRFIASGLYFRGPRQKRDRSLKDY